jgi:hypothetical protein
VNEYYMTPSDVDVEIEGLESVNEPGADGFSVAYRVTRTSGRRGGSKEVKPS